MWARISTRVTSCTDDDVTCPGLFSRDKWCATARQPVGLPYEAPTAPGQQPAQAPPPTGRHGAAPRPLRNQGGAQQCSPPSRLPFQTRHERCCSFDDRRLQDLPPPEFMGAEWPELMPCGGKCEDSYCSNVTLEAVRGKHLSTPCRAARVGGDHTPAPEPVLCRVPLGSARSSRDSSCTYICDRPKPAPQPSHSVLRANPTLG